MRRGIDYKGAADRPPRSCWSQLLLNLRLNNNYVGDELHVHW
jgi:hypothetical protein